MLDQATRLREMAAALRVQATGNAPRRTKVIAITSGKGGVGKTNLSVNLAHALIEAGKEVILLDADLGLANVDILLGTVAPYHLGHLLRGERDIMGVIHHTPRGLKIIAGGAGLGELANVSREQLQLFVHNLRKLEGEADYLIFDTGAGVGVTVLEFVLAADQVIIVTTPEPTSLADAYTMIKAMSRKAPHMDVKLVVNQADRAADGESAAERIIVTARDFLSLPVEHLATIPRDSCVTKAVRAKVPFVLSDPLAPASTAIKGLARRLLDEPVPAPEANVRPAPSFFDRLTKKLLGRDSAR
ncbi:MAG TPA: MinD/ParA family protein [Symbiobacteriaceae bacterium]|jgi:flagellar biosynthesis protein FlhG